MKRLDALAIDLENLIPDGMLRDLTERLAEMGAAVHLLRDLKPFAAAMLAAHMAHMIESYSDEDHYERTRRATLGPDPDPQPAGGTPGAAGEPGRTG